MKVYLVNGDTRVILNPKYGDQKLLAKWRKKGMSVSETQIAPRCVVRDDAEMARVEQLLKK